MMWNKGNRPLAVTAIALLSFATGLLTLFFNMFARDFNGFYFALNPSNISQVWGVIFGIFMAILSAAMFSGSKWVWYASMVIWAAAVIIWIAETITLSSNLVIFSLPIYLNMWYFFRQDIQQYFNVKAFWTWE